MAEPQLPAGWLPKDEFDSIFSRVPRLCVEVVIALLGYIEYPSQYEQREFLARRLGLMDSRELPSFREQ